MSPVYSQNPAKKHGHILLVLLLHITCHVNPQHLVYRCIVAIFFFRWFYVKFYNIENIQSEKEPITTLHSQSNYSLE